MILSTNGGVILYHFTANQLLRRVETEGITKCVVPWRLLPGGGVKMMRNLQWLTSDPEFDSQGWAARGITAEHLMRKTDWRLTVEIPTVAAMQVEKWTDFCERNKLPVASYFSKFGGQHFWRVYIGKIPPRWIVAKEANPTPFDPSAGLT